MDGSQISSDHSRSCLRTLCMVAFEVHAALFALSRMLDQHVAVLGLDVRVRSAAKRARKALRFQRRRPFR